MDRYLDNDQDDYISILFSIERVFSIKSIIAFISRPWTALLNFYDS